MTYSQSFCRVTTSTALHNHQLASSSLATHIIMDNTSEYCTTVFSLANVTYKDLRHEGTWNTAVRPEVDNASTMVTDSTHPSSSNRCWNCGETNCNVDPIRIAANQKLFYNNNKRPRMTSPLPKHLPRTLNPFLVHGAIQNLVNITNVSSLENLTPTILPNQDGMRMKPLQVALLQLHLHQHQHLVLLPPSRLILLQPIPRVSLLPKCVNMSLTSLTSFALLETSPLMPDTMRFMLQSSSFSGFSYIPLKSLFTAPHPFSSLSSSIHSLISCQWSCSVPTSLPLHRRRFSFQI